MYGDVALRKTLSTTGRNAGFVLEVARDDVLIEPEVPALVLRELVEHAREERILHLLRERAIDEEAEQLLVHVARRDFHRIVGVRE